MQRKVEEGRRVDSQVFKGTDEEPHWQPKWALLFLASVCALLSVPRRDPSPLERLDKGACLVLEPSPCSSCHHRLMPFQAWGGRCLAMSPIHTSCILTSTGAFGDGRCYWRRRWGSINTVAFLVHVLPSADIALALQAGPSRSDNNQRAEKRTLPPHLDVRAASFAAPA
jgi:hypothetical protein